MAETRKIILEVDVNDSDVGALRSELDKTADSFNKVDKEAGNASTSIKDVGENGGAIAVLDSVTGGMATRMRDAAEATKLFNFSLKGMRTALIATGIGALVVAVGTLIAYWDEINDLVTRVDAGLEVQLETTTKISEQLDAQLALIDKQIESNELQGKSNELLFKQKEALLDQLKVQNEAEIKVLENQLERLKATQAEYDLWVDIGDEFTKMIFGSDALAKRQAERMAANIQAVKDLETAILNARIKGVELDMVLYNMGTGKGTEGRGQVSTVSSLTPQQAAQLDGLATFEDAKTKVARQGALSREAIAAAEADAKIAIQNAYIDNVSGAINVLQDVFEGNKKIQAALLIAENAAGIAKIIVNTQVANAKAIAASPLTAGQPWVGINTVAAGISIAASVAATAKGLSQLGGGGGGSTSLGRGDLGGGGVAAPQFNVVGSSGVNQLAGVVGDRLAQPVRAFVTMGDVNTAQQLEVDAVRESSLG